MIISIYNLPEISFIGGESEKFAFNLHTITGRDFDATDCEAGFAIINYINKNGEAILKKDATIEEGESGYNSVVVVELEQADTISLHGRYIYQLTLTNAEGKTEIPGQGIIDITRNIHPEFALG